MNILAIGAHPDDIELGCYSTLEKYKAQGNEIIGLIYTKGRDDPMDQKLDTIPLLTITQAMERVVKEIEPDIVFTHSEHDLNRDHQIIHWATLTACRDVHCDIYCYEVPSLYHHKFTPQLFMNVKSSIKKQRFLKRKYGKEMREQPHPRSTDGIATLMKYRGNQVNLHYAEAFEVMRIIK